MSEIQNKNKKNNELYKNKVFGKIICRIFKDKILISNVIKFYNFLETYVFVEYSKIIYILCIKLKNKPY